MNMKKILCGFVMAMAFASGCAASPELIKTSSISSRSDVFKEVAGGGTVPEGFADLRISASLKTHNPGVYSSTRDVHGSQDYKILLNIDGQAMQLQGRLRQEKSEPRGLRDPEAGEGTRYTFSSNLRLKAGVHRVVIAVPADELAMEKNIALPAGKNTLTLEPVYRTTAVGKQRPGSHGETAFREGIKWFRIVLNGEEL